MAHPVEEKPSGTELRRAARDVLEAHWRDPGFTCPNAGTYPWLWLWDSCFHALVWAELDEPERALSELRVALEGQWSSGFVPHMRYMDMTREFDLFWGVPTTRSLPSTSSITQPPVYAWVVSQLVSRGMDVPRDLIERSVDGLWFLLEGRRRSAEGLIEIVHPWESGCDHSPRWDDVMLPGDPTVDRYDRDTWFRRKEELLASIERDRRGAPIANPEFPVGSVAFTSIVAHGARALAPVAGDRGLAEAADGLAAALVQRWDPGRRTFCDSGPTAGGSGSARTAEALLGVLVVDDAEILGAIAGELMDPLAFGGRYGPSQVHRDEVTFRRDSYWRGPSWPQISFLLHSGLEASGVPSALTAAAHVSVSLAAGAWESGWAEYWDPDDARPGGAVPQSWATLAVLHPTSRRL